MDEKVMRLRETPPKSRAVMDEVMRLRAYLRVIDPPRPPAIGVTWAEIQRDGMIPSYVLIRLMRRAEERARIRQARAEKVRALWGKCLEFANLGFTGWSR